MLIINRKIFISTDMLGKMFFFRQLYLKCYFSVNLNVIVHYLTNFIKVCSFLINKCILILTNYTHRLGAINLF